MKNPRIGEDVILYDRYRFAIPVKGTVAGIAGPGNDGVRVTLRTTNSFQYPVGSDVWVSRRQLRRDKGK